MKISELSHAGGLSKEQVKLLNDAGIEELYPPQEEALKQGLLSLKSSFIISVPTASGKTLIAELLMVKSILERKGKCLYIVPLRALASEKIEEFKKYEKLGIRAAISTGDYDTSDSWLANYDIIVTTSEKADSLLRHKSNWLAEIKVLVVDEIHLIHDASRGPTLEVTVAKLRHLNPEMLVLGLSATIKNAGEIASWLNAKLVSMDWRPVPLREGVFLQGEIFFNDSKCAAVEKISSDNCKASYSPGEYVQSVALEVVRDKGQSLVFVNNRKAAEKFALEIAEKTKKFVSRAEERSLKVFANQVLEVLSEPTKICKRLAKCIESGAAFHHAGLATKQRRAVEEAFRKNLIKVLSATPTLAAGVNLPARRVVVRDYTRYDVNVGRVEIPVLEYKQQAGRAGRPKYDRYGEAILIARSEEEKAYLLDSYILAEPEEIGSKLAIEGALRTHVLATIAMGYANSLSSLMEFFSKTFFAHQQEPYLLEAQIHKIVNFLLREKMCAAKEKNSFIAPTFFGKRVSELYIDPLSAVILRDALFRAQKTKTNELSYLHTISHTPELGSLYLRSKDYEMCVKEARENEEHLLVEMPDSSEWKFEEFLSEVKTALFLSDWIDERSEDFILEKYGLGPGDIRSKVELADWLLYSMFELGKVFAKQAISEGNTGMMEKLGEIAKLRERVKHGIKEELLELVSLSGIGRVRARRLYAHGLKTLKDLKKADIATISSVELIGKKIALNIKKQLGEKVEEDNRKSRGLADAKHDQSKILEF